MKVDYNRIEKNRIEENRIEQNIHFLQLKSTKEGKNSIVEGEQSTDEG